MIKTYSLEKPDTMPVSHVSLESVKWTGKWMQVMRQTHTRVSDGKVFPWEVLVKKNASIILPVTRDGEMIFIDQFRYPIMDWELECPAETLDQEGDTPESAAMRALREEIGYRTERLIAMPTYASSWGTTNELAYTFLALDCTPLDTGHARSDDEIIRVNHVPLREVNRFLDARVKQGQILNSKVDGLVGRYMSGRF